MQRTRTKNIRTLFAVVASAVCAVVPYASPASATPGAGGDEMSFGKYDASITQSNFYIYDNWNPYATHRSGSGNGNLDECVTNAGPLPDGDYSSNLAPYHTDTFSGSAIYGRVVRLQNKVCYNGTNRTALFIHTEETSSAGIGTTEPQRWDGNSDYYSQGCIKLSRGENGGTNGIGVLDWWWHTVGGGANNTSYSSVINVYWL